MVLRTLLQAGVVNVGGHGKHGHVDVGSPHLGSRVDAVGCLHDDDKLWERYYGDDDSDVSIIFEPDFD